MTEHTNKEIKKALELHEYWLKDDSADDKHPFHVWLQLQLKPKATLFERFKAYEEAHLIKYCPMDHHPNDPGFLHKVKFKFFKEHFKEELAPKTAGLREVIKKMETMKGEPRGVCILEAKAILERMEGEG